MDVIERIKSQLETHQVILYMKGSPDFPMCAGSDQVVRILRTCGETFTAVDILEDEELCEALKSYSNFPTYPQLYIKGQLIGGSEIIFDLFNKGELFILFAGIDR